MVDEDLGDIFEVVIAVEVALVDLGTVDNQVAFIGIIEGNLLGIAFFEGGSHDIGIGQAVARDKGLVEVNACQGSIGNGAVEGFGNLSHLPANEIELHLLGLVVEGLEDRQAISNHTQVHVIHHASKDFHRCSGPKEDGFTCLEIGEGSAGCGFFEININDFLIAVGEFLVRVVVETDRSPVDPAELATLL